MGRESQIAIGRELERSGDRGSLPQRASLLVRCWVEEVGENGPVVRGLLRNLQTGQERPFADAGAVQDFVLEELGCTSPAGPEPAEFE